MAANVYIFSPIRSSSFRLDTLFPITHLQPIFNSPCCSLSVARSSTTSSFGLRLGATRLPNRSPKPPAALMLPENPVASDILAAGLSGCIALSLLRLWGETANRRIFDQVKTKLMLLLFQEYMSCQGVVLACVYPLDRSFTDLGKLLFFIRAYFAEKNPSWFRLVNLSRLVNCIKSRIGKWMGYFVDMVVKQ